jgi:hypothetical protein
MSADTAKPSSSGTPRKRYLLAAAALVVVVVIVVVVVVVVTRGGDSDTATPDDLSAVTLVTSPYDMIELPSDIDLDVVSKASFISILVPDDSGKLTSYGVSSDLPAAKALMQAVADGKAVDDETAASVTASTVPASGGSNGTATITFVFASRETLTFALALADGLVARGSKAWKPEGDLKALVQAAIKSPQ